MFHSSTTIRHSPFVSQVRSGENRLVFKEAISGINKYDAFVETHGTKAGGWVKEHLPRLHKTGSVLWKLAWPIRIGLFPLRYPLGWTIDGVSWGLDKAFEEGRYLKQWGIELGGATKKGASSVWELVKGPLLFAKRNIVDQVRDGVKGALRVGWNTLASPKRFLVDGLGNSIKETRKGIGEVWKLKWHGLRNPIKAANATRKAIWASLKAPFVAAGAPVAEEAKKMIWKDMDKKDATHGMVGNVVSSVMAYPEQMGESYNRVDEGLTILKGAHSKAKLAMVEKPAPKKEEEGGEGEEKPSKPAKPNKPEKPGKPGKPNKPNKPKNPPAHPSGGGEEELQAAA
jgi:hypothetical protein